ncbi:hypothetical protein ACU6U9_02580 [Pseudomonas sp. HK3]|jgi:DNA-binding MarR family transcriptional regulator
MQVLSYVAVNPNHCMQGAADALNIELNTVYYIARSLEKGLRGREGYQLISIKTDRHDKRLRRLTLTKKGKEAYHLFAQLNQGLDEGLKIRDENTIDMFEK